MKETLVQLLKEKYHYSASEIKERLQISSFQLLNLFMDLLMEWFQNFDFKKPRSQQKFLYKCFKYLNDQNLYSEKEEIEKILLKLSQLEKMVIQAIKNGNGYSKSSYIDIKFFLQKILSNIELSKTSLQYMKQDLIEQTNKRKDAKHFVYYILFEIKQFHYIEELFKNYPELLTIQNEQGENLLEEVLNRYMNLLASKADFETMIYFEKIIHFLLNNPNFAIAKGERKRYIKKLRSEISSLPFDLYSLEEYQAIKIALENIVNEIREAGEQTIERTELYLNYKYGMQQGFSKEALKSLKKSALDPNISVLDLTNKHIITLDSNGAHILEDAVSLEQLANGNYLLGIYVADVSSRIPQNSVIDQAAYQRGFSFYSPNHSVNDMLPRDYVKKIISLEAGKPSLVKAHLLEFSSSMDLIHFEVKEAVILVDQNYTFSQVNHIIKREQSLGEYQFIKFLLEFSQKIDLNAEYRTQYHKIKEQQRSLLHWSSKQKYEASYGSMIMERFTVYVNYLVARYFDEHKNLFPGFFRNNTFSKDTITWELLHREYRHDQSIVEMIENLGMIYEPSTYAPINLGHQGLHLDSYCHATIPARNYGSLLVQRLEDDFLIQKRNGDEQLIGFYEEFLSKAATHLNARALAHREYAREYQKVIQKNIDKL